MFIFGHLGIGSTVVRPWTRGLSRRWVFAGILAPDILDKSLYYGLVFITGQRGDALGLISGTRTFGHTALLLIGIVFASVISKSRALAAFSLGMASHLLLDNVMDRILLATRPADYSAGDAPTSAVQALLYPFYAGRFATMPFTTTLGHLETILNPYILTCEFIGVGLLLWDQWKRSHRADVLFSFRRLGSLKRKIFKRGRRLESELEQS